MTTINFELSKRLNDLWLLDNIKTEYWYEYDNETKNYNIDYFLPFNKNIICKTLTLEEAIEFLPDSIMITKHNNCNEKYLIDYNTDDYNEDFSWKTLLEAIEKMLEYLLDNNLLIK